MLQDLESIKLLSEEWTCECFLDLKREADDLRNLLPKKSNFKMPLFYSQYPAHEPSVYQIVSLEIEVTTHVLH